MVKPPPAYILDGYKGIPVSEKVCTENYSTKHIQCQNLTFECFHNLIVVINIISCQLCISLVGQGSPGGKYVKPKKSLEQSLIQVMFKNVY